MRRVWALLLVAFVSFSLIDLTLFADGASTLAACCRRDGKHHCAMMGSMPAPPSVSSSSSQVASARCPNFPKLGVVSASAAPVLLEASQAFFSAIVVYSATPAPTEVRPLVF